MAEILISFLNDNQWNPLFDGFLFASQGFAFGRPEPVMMMFFLRFDSLVIVQKLPFNLPK